jgi:hypothetical protein
MNGDLVLNTSGSNKDIRLASASDLYIAYTGGTALSMNAGAGTIIVPGDLHIYVPGTTLSLLSGLSADNMVIYAGVLNTNGKDIETARDFVLLGGLYDADDTAGAAPSGVAGLFALITRYESPTDPTPETSLRIRTSRSSP